MTYARSITARFPDLRLARCGRLRRTKVDVEALEPRQLMSIAVQRISPQTIAPQSSPLVFDLNQVFTDSLDHQADLNFGAHTDNTGLLQANISGTLLTVTTGANASGFGRVTVAAAAPDGSTAVQTFRVQVTASTDRTLNVTLDKSHPSVRFIKDDNTVGTITLSGPGVAAIQVGGDNLHLTGARILGSGQEIENIALSGTTTSSMLSITGVAQKHNTIFADVGNITGDGSLGGLRLSKVILVGDVTFSGGVRNCSLDAAENGTITLGQGSGSTKLTVRNILDENFAALNGISFLQCGRWISTDSLLESFSAPSINSLRCTDTFHVDLHLSGSGIGRTLGSVTVADAVGGTWTIAGQCGPMLIGGSAPDWDATFGSLVSLTATQGDVAGVLSVPSLPLLNIERGNLSGATLNLTAAGTEALGRVMVRGLITNSKIFSAGDIRSISAGGFRSSTVFAGVAPLPQGQALPASISDLSGSATIGSVMVRKNRNVVGFLSSEIAASTIRTLSLSTTQVENNGIPFGIAASTIRAISVRDLTNGRTIALVNVNDPVVLSTKISALGLDLKDLVIRVLQ